MTQDTLHENEVFKLKLNFQVDDDCIYLVSVLVGGR